MHSMDCSVDYSKALCMEKSIAKAVIQRMDAIGSQYIPLDLVSGKFIFFAADKLDFLEDTVDGKGTLHATVMTSYQEYQDSELNVPLTVSGPSTNRSLKFYHHL